MNPLKSALRLFRDPSRLEEVFVLEQHLIDRPALARIRARVEKHPAAAEAIASRRRLGVIRVSTAAACPAGSLGDAYARYLTDNGLDPGALPTRPAEDDLAYVDAHLYETHDFWHVATGFGADVSGELGVQAFYLAQMPGRLAPLLILGGILNALLWNWRDLGRRLRAVARGWRLGRRARPLFGVDWRARLDDPIETVRTDLGLYDSDPPSSRYESRSIACVSSQR